MINNLRGFVNIYRRIGRQAQYEFISHVPTISFDKIRLFILLTFPLLGEVRFAGSDENFLSPSDFDE
jgi:hypothetical protein